MSVRTESRTPSYPTPVHAAGAALRDALVGRDFATARSLMADDVRFRMLVPSGVMVDEGADATVARISSWFAEAEPFGVVDSTVEEVQGRAAMTYRFRLRRPDGWKVIEQHLMVDVGDDGRVTAIDLLCSGFRPLTVGEETDGHRFDAGDLGCADGLAAEFRRRVQQVPVGHVLEVTTRDPAAKEDLPSLARLMGHIVRSIEAPGDGRLVVSVERGH